ncbi:hypothetical protein NC651_011814 [Populus alba x Populus x berolinensis]|nr:hypothetical protein NC651_011814 [Populus alba x Populus x berolinensis]
MKRKRDAPTLLQSCMFLNTTPVLAVAGHCCSSLDCSHVTTKVMLLCLYLFLGSTNDYWQPLDRDDHEGCRVEVKKKKVLKTGIRPIKRAGVVNVRSASLRAATPVVGVLSFTISSQATG